MGCDEVCVFRRCFLIYRYPGKPATVISEDDFVDKVKTTAGHMTQPVLRLVSAHCRPLLLPR